MLGIGLRAITHIRVLFWDTHSKRRIRFDSNQFWEMQKGNPGHKYGEIDIQNKNMSCRTPSISTVCRTQTQWEHFVIRYSRPSYKQQTKCKNVICWKLETRWTQCAIWGYDDEIVEMEEIDNAKYGVQVLPMQVCCVYNLLCTDVRYLSSPLTFFWILVSSLYVQDCSYHIIYRTICSISV